MTLSKVDFDWYVSCCYHLQTPRHIIVIENTLSLSMSPTSSRSHSSDRVVLGNTSQSDNHTDSTFNTFPESTFTSRRPGPTLPLARPDSRLAFYHCPPILYLKTSSVTRPTVFLQALFANYAEC